MRTRTPLSNLIDKKVSNSIKMAIFRNTYIFAVGCRMSLSGFKWTLFQTLGFDTGYFTFSFMFDWFVAYLVSNLKHHTLWHLPEVYYNIPFSHSTVSASFYREPRKILLEIATRILNFQCRIVRNLCIFSNVKSLDVHFSLPVTYQNFSKLTWNF